MWITNRIRVLAGVAGTITMVGFFMGWTQFFLFVPIPLVCAALLAGRRPRLASPLLLLGAIYVSLLVFPFGIGMLLAGVFKAGLTADLSLSFVNFLVFLMMLSVLVCDLSVVSAILKKYRSGTKSNASTSIDIGRAARWITAFTGVATLLSGYLLYGRRFPRTAIDWGIALLGMALLIGALLVGRWRKTGQMFMIAGAITLTAWAIPLWYFDMYPWGVGNSVSALSVCALVILSDLVLVQQEWRESSDAVRKA